MRRGRFAQAGADPDQGTVTITNYPEAAVGAIKIPKTIDNKPVTSIADYELSRCSGLTSVTLPEKGGGSKVQQWDLSLVEELQTIARGKP